MASLVRIERFVFKNGMWNYREVVPYSFDWWTNENDNSKQRQEGFFYTLCALYALVAFVALVQLTRIQMRVPGYGWTTQKAFHLMNFVVNGLRAILFGLYKKVFFLRPKIFEMILLDIPGLLFFSTYTLLVLFWAEIYHQARSLPTNKLRPVYFIVNGVMYFVQVCIWIYLRPSQKPIAVAVAKLFFSVISFFAALGFLIYGGRLFFMLRRFPIESRGRQKKLYEVASVTGICCTCFLIRCFVVALSAFDKHADIDVLNHPLLNFVYYTLVEIVPSSLVLFILRKLPPRRVSVSDQYHPIE
ncbi:PREDICTED: tobamovirus multiplication protein 1-like isoform X1 [Nelumbo nucifera]|uniref:Tobamovirus multiplication protein 1-like isoform X1 n=1 Tax=Nelumbo nucifera TaxID=4432 RepID=A0A1U8B0E0_NELNU|nr:PREDICTED: tobamovirus multiplication protein 1-like isoform X1 [Nelumbo nucifera]